MFPPQKDHNPLKIIPFQIFMVSIIVACVAVFIWQTSLMEHAS